MSAAQGFRMITVIDSGIANTGSVLSAFRRMGTPTVATTVPAEVLAARAILLPGVGTFGDGMASLHRHGLVEAIRTAVGRGASLLGICLGMQLLAERSEEFGDHEGLGLVPGEVRRLQARHAGERVPNIGWCDVAPREGARVFRSVEPGTAFYFAHSYHLACRDDADIAAEMSFGDDRVTVAVQHGGVHGVQFHPEKSQDAGFAVLSAFAEAVEG